MSGRALHTTDDVTASLTKIRPVSDSRADFSETRSLNVGILAALLSIYFHHRINIRQRTTVQFVSHVGYSSLGIRLLFSGLLL